MEVEGSAMFTVQLFKVNVKVFPGKIPWSIYTVYTYQWYMSMINHAQVWYGKHCRVGIGSP